MTKQTEYQLGGPIIIPSGQTAVTEQQFAESAKLEKAIRENLKGLGYEA